MLDKNDLFLRMVVHALLGACLGFVSGLFFGLLIQFITGFLPGFAQMTEGPHQIAPFLGMGFGTLVGAILGGIASLKK